MSTSIRRRDDRMVSVPKERYEALVEIERRHKKNQVAITKMFRETVNGFLTTQHSNLILEPHGDDGTALRVRLHRNGDRFLSDAYDKGEAYIHVSQLFYDLLTNTAEKLGGHLEMNNSGTIVYVRLPLPE